MDQDKKAGLFHEFSPISTSQWEEKIREDLKGADYEKKLIWKTPEGLKIKPYYRGEDLENVSHMGALPNGYPFVRGKHFRQNPWDIRQDIEESDIEKANALAVDALKRGAEAVGLSLEKVAQVEQVDMLLKGLHAENHGLHFMHAKNYNAFFKDFLGWIGREEFDKKKVRGSLDFDPLGYFLLYGKFYGSADANFNDAVELLKLARENTPLYRVINVNGQHVHNAGAHIVQELAFALGQGNEYLASLTPKGLSVDDVAPYMQFTLPVGSNYFLEIGKLRAAKLLWAKIVEQYNPQNPESMKMNIHAVSSGWNKSVYDPYVNMLRTTTEAMAAAIGGVDSMTVAPFDRTFKKADEFSSRIARNQQNVLKKEAYFDKVADPAAGSYYIENITDQIARASWDLFKEIELKGGFIKAAEEGFIKQEIDNTCQKRDMDIAMRKHVFVGVNQYPNLQEQVLDKIQPTADLADLGGLKPYRGMQAFEALRLSVENHQKKGFEIPKIYLFTYGNLAMRKARATFATNFFGCAGYQIQEAPFIKDLQDGIEKALEAKAHAIVFCSSDEEYGEMAQAAQVLKNRQPDVRIVVAGNPKEIMDQLNEAGVQHYIHMRTNALETLQTFNEIFGIA